MERKPYRRFALRAFSLVFAVAAGCGGNAALTRANEIFVVSDPPGADVFAAGNRIGTTPLAVRQQDVFPVAFPPERQEVYGTLLISKEGCKDNTVRVTNLVLRKGVDVRLDCGREDLAKSQPGAAGIPLPIKDRLLRLNELRDQGIITAEEYREIRAKILGEL